MSRFSIPRWVEPHLYTGKNFKDLTEADIADLRERISRFKSDEPDISIMMPAWNEENNIYRALSSLASNETNYKVELVVINNNSTDGTQTVLDALGVRNYFQPEQGTPHARQLGLEMAKGKYHLCADCDTYYPPKWMDLMVKPMAEKPGIVGVYGRYSFMPPEGQGRFGLAFYEMLTGILIRLKKAKREHLNVLGFNMGLITKVGRDTGGFKVTEVRKFDNAAGSEYFVDEAEDGKMALNLKTAGKLELVTDSKARVFTSSRRLVAEGGIFQSFVNRIKLHRNRMNEYFAGQEVK